MKIRSVGTALFAEGRAAVSLGVFVRLSAWNNAFSWNPVFAILYEHLLTHSDFG
jgi:hypothetical protein